MYKRQAVTPVSDIEISKESSIQIDGLDTGTYRLIETKAPEGYVKPTGYIEITLEDTVDENSKNVPDGKLDKIEITNNGTYEIINNATTGSGNFSFIVKNRTPEDFNLPVTGGTGTLMSVSYTHLSSYFVSVISLSCLIWFVKTKKDIDK